MKKLRRRKTAYSTRFVGFLYHRFCQYSEGLLFGKTLDEMERAWIKDSKFDYLRKK